MGAVPKKKVSNGKQGKRASHFHLRHQSLSECSQCHSAKQPHRVCPTCGYYNGREVIKKEPVGGPV
jgi:large subunit ribosomal protein L32